MPTPNSRSQSAGTTPNAPGAPIVSTLAGDPDMVELIQLFVEEIPERVRALQEFWQRGELDELRRIAHQIKGAGGGYGFPTLGDTAAKLEQEIKLAANSPDHTASIARQVEELTHICARLRAA
jgi:HPt (histidine-containing phosphotransfer) domain-containing protein